MCKTVLITGASGNLGTKLRAHFASLGWSLRLLDVDAREEAEIAAAGVSKLVGERLGRSYRERWGLTVICLRIGYCQRGENAPGPHMGWGS